ncbi:unnamed protein product [Adineta ricciae]|uniref:Uncharacterized protein n=1 Tax=Adineta ricciae TaxID=249248 RepID=A0A813PWU5_ADIRI|nr:unnamed protein product [Adineta ricciae]
MHLKKSKPSPVNRLPSLYIPTLIQSESNYQRELQRKLQHIEHENHDLVRRRLTTDYLFTHEHLKKRYQWFNLDKSFRDTCQFAWSKQKNRNEHVRLPDICPKGNFSIQTDPYEVEGNDSPTVANEKIKQKFLRTQPVMIEILNTPHSYEAFKYKYDMDVHKKSAQKRHGQVQRNAIDDQRYLRLKGMDSKQCTQDVSIEHRDADEKQTNEMKNEKQASSPEDNPAQKELKTSSIKFLFQYMTPMDIFYVIMAITASCITGLRTPLYFLFFGNSVGLFVARSSNLCSINFTSLSEEYCPPGIELTPTNYYTVLSSCNFTDTNHDLRHQTQRQINFILILSAVMFLFEYFRLTMFDLIAERQVRSMKRKLFHTILQQDMIYFDHHKTGELDSLLTTDMTKIHAGIGNKFGLLINTVSAIICSLILCFTLDWNLTLVFLSASTSIVLAPIVVTKLIAKFMAIELTACKEAGAIAEEVFSSIRTVFSYNGQKKEMQRYEQHVDTARKSSVRKDIFNGLVLSICTCLIWNIMAFGFWYGYKRIREGDVTLANICTTFATLSTCIYSIKTVGPYFQAVVEALAAASNIEKTINESKRNDTQKVGKQSTNLVGDIDFVNVFFSYPTRRDVTVLNNLSFKVKCGQTVAVVGSSGSGKSTCVQLLQKFYEIDSGEILIDGLQINEYDRRWLRQQIGVVNQEPVLFHTTIRENILFGTDSATDEEIHQAAKVANAHDFIMCLPDKYETQVGERGAALSGGQKQRIAIARALLRNPKILLLDEATSALDNESEMIVQDALDRAAQGRTTIIIAHRLSTIRHADHIIVLKKGEIVEEGDHESLTRAKGVYFDLVQQQLVHQVGEDEELTFEQEEMKRQLLSAQSHLDVSRERSSTVISMTPSVLKKLYEKESTVIRQNDAQVYNTVKNRKAKQSNPIMNILRISKPEWIVIGVGCVMSVIIGAADVFLCILQTEMITSFQECNRDRQERTIVKYALIIVGCSIIYSICHLVRACMFAHSGSKITQRLRSKTFDAILRQDIGFFDDVKHSTGALCTILTTDVSIIQNITSVELGSIVQNLALFIACTIIGFAYSWQLALLNSAFLPIILLAIYGQIHITERFANQQKKVLEDAGKLTVEAIQNIRTVVQLTKEEHFYNEYCRLLTILYKSSQKQIHITSLLSSLTLTSSMFSVAAAYSLGVTLLNENIITDLTAVLIMEFLIFMSQAALYAFVSIPNYGKSIRSARSIFNLIKRKPTINNQSSDGDKISNYTGQLVFKDVYFVYPTRTESIVLKKFNFTIKSGQTVALVGSSGSGKSTAIQLIERFYDPNIGQILIDSKDIRSLDLQWYRSQIGIVSQEPVLLDISIRENIAYGDNNRKDIPLDEIIEVAKTANIHDFIQLLPDAYETICGAKGLRLSGGQKQRIAIARALLRNPKILLLDEATSALDSENEKIVQEALERAQKNRTSIIIAHRLSTIQNCDVIYVMHNGIIVEYGTHIELLARGGRYYRLVQGKLK